MIDCPPGLLQAIYHWMNFVEPIVSGMVARHCCGVVVEMETAEESFEMVNGLGIYAWC